MDNWRHPKTSRQHTVPLVQDGLLVSIAQRLQQAPTTQTDKAFVDAIRASNQLPIPNDLMIAIHVPDEHKTGLSYQKWALPMINQIKWLASHFDPDRRLCELHVYIKTQRPIHMLIRHLLNRIDAHFHVAEDAKLSIHVPFGLARKDIIDHAKPFSKLHIDYLTPIDRINPCDAQWINKQRSKDTSIGLSLDAWHCEPMDEGPLTETIRQMIWLEADRISFESMNGTTDFYHNILEDLIDKSSLWAELEQNEYHAIGSGMFARPSCPLAQAFRECQLDLGIDGYLTRPRLDQLGIGLGAISLVGDYLATNDNDPSTYLRALDSAQFPIAHGMALTGDDVMRQVIIAEIVCRYQLSVDEIQQRFGVCFKHHFPNQYEKMTLMRASGLLEGDSKCFRVTDEGLDHISRMAAMFAAPIGVH